MVKIFADSCGASEAVPPLPPASLMVSQLVYAEFCRDVEVEQPLRLQRGCLQDKVKYLQCIADRLASALSGSFFARYTTKI